MALSLERLLVLLIMVVWCRSFPSVPSQLPLSALKATVTSHKELGEKIGLNFQSEIRTAISSDSFFQEHILAYNKTEEGAMAYTNMLGVVKTAFAVYVQELEGMADGAGIDFPTLFLWNLYTEMELLLRKDMPIPSCTDIYIKGNSTAMGHNEDGSKMDYNISYLVSAEVFSTDGLMPLENFTAFCYPGKLCGNAFGFNPARRVVLSTNALFPKTINTKAFPRTFLNRALLTLSYAEIVGFLNRFHCASGFSLNIGEYDTFELSNIEVSPDSVLQTVYFQNGSGYHFNMYMHSNDVQQWEDPSSMHRMQRVKELAPPTTIDDLKTILGDTSDKQYPIFRTAKPPDSGATLATGIFDFDQKMFYIFRDNPVTQSPLMTISME